MKDLSFNYVLLLNNIDKKYKGDKIEYKINEFCRDTKIKIYRFKRILESKAYFQNDEMYRIMNHLEIKENEIGEYFFKIA